MVPASPSGLATAASESVVTWTVTRTVTVHGTVRTRTPAVPARADSDHSPEPPWHSVTSHSGWRTAGP